MVESPRFVEINLYHDVFVIVGDKRSWNRETPAKQRTSTNKTQQDSRLLVITEFYRFYCFFYVVLNIQRFFE